MKPDWTYSWDDDAEDLRRDRWSPPSGEDAAPGFWSGSFGVAARLAGVGAALVSVTIAVLASTDLRSPAEAPQPVSPSAARAVEPPPAPLPEAGATAILVPAAAIHAPPVRPIQGPVLPRVMSLAPADLCKIIGFGGKAGRWQPSPVYPKEWECLSTRSEGGGAGKAAPASGFRIFAMARGTGEEDVRYVRLKISASDEARADESAKLAAERLKQLFEAIDWPLPERALLSTRLRQPFLLDDEGTSIRLVEEKMTALSYNLIVSFPKAPALAKAARERAKAARETAAFVDPTPATH